MNRYFGEYTCWDDVLKDLPDIGLPTNEPELFFALLNSPKGGNPSSNRFVCYKLGSGYFSVGFVGFLSETSYEKLTKLVLIDTYNFNTYDCFLYIKECVLTAAIPASEAHSFQPKSLIEI